MGILRVSSKWALSSDTHIEYIKESFIFNLLQHALKKESSTKWSKSWDSWNEVPGERQVLGHLFSNQPKHPSSSL